MPLVQSNDSDITTVIIDTGIGAIVVWVPQAISKVQEQLELGKYVSGDSSWGEIHFHQDSVKFMQSGKRELNQIAANRPSGLPL